MFAAFLLACGSVLLVERGLSGAGAETARHDPIAGKGLPIPRSMGHSGLDLCLVW